MNIHKLRLTTIFVIIAAICVAAASYFLPAPSGTPASDDARANTVVVIMLSALSISAASLFFIGLKNFRTEAIKAYYFICAGLLGIGIGYAVIPLSLYTQSWFSDLNTYAAQLPLLAAAASIYTGVYLLARLLRLPIMLTPLIVLPVIGVIAVILLLVQHNPVVAPSELAFDLAHVIIFFDIATAISLWRLVGAISPTYRRALVWLASAITCKIIAASCFVLFDYVTVPKGIDITQVGLLYVVQTLLFIKAGYEFNKITLAASRQQQGASIIDVLVYMASLASNPREIDTILDPMREITTVLGPDTKPNAEQQQQLLSVGQQLREYLVTKEPLRAFTPESLRHHLTTKFELDDSFFGSKPVKS